MECYVRQTEFAPGIFHCFTFYELQVDVFQPVRNSATTQLACSVQGCDFITRRDMSAFQFFAYKNLNRQPNRLWRVIVAAPDPSALTCSPAKLGDHSLHLQPVGGRVKAFSS